MGERYSVYDSAATRYWTDNQGEASVSSNGVVTAHSPGKAAITLIKELLFSDKSSSLSGDVA
ncbi:Ig-like domain-containing protein [Bacillus sp. Bos-x628]